MKAKKEETASFVVRFNQKIFKDEDGNHQVQWRGNIRHVQGGEEERFSKFEDVVKFIQEKLASLAVDGMEEKSEEEKKSILASGFEMFRQVTTNTPKKFIEAILDPKTQIAEIQERVQSMNENINQKITELVEEKLEIDKIRAASKSDFRTIMERLDKMSEDIAALNSKIENLSDK